MLLASTQEVFSLLYFFPLARPPPRMHEHPVQELEHGIQGVSLHFPAFEFSFFSPEISRWGRSVAEFCEEGFEFSPLTSGLGTFFKVYFGYFVGY